MNGNRTEYGQAEPNDMLDIRLTRALEAPPSVEIPQDFAYRVASQAQAAGGSALVPSRSALSNVGGRVAWAASVLLLLAVVAVLAPSSAALPGKQWIALGLELEFAALTAWLSLRTARQQG